MLETKMPKTRDVNVLKTEKLIPPADLIEELPATPSGQADGRRWTPRDPGDSRMARTPGSS